MENSCDVVVTDFTKILIAAGNKTFEIRKHKLKKPTSRRQSMKTNKWYDGECRQLRTQMRSVRRKMLASPFNVGIQQHYLSCCRKYKYALKQKRKLVRENLLEKLVLMAEKTLESLKSLENSNNSVTDNINSDEWYEHFKVIGSKQIEITKERQEILNDLYHAENEIHTDSQELLDKPFTVGEVKNVVNKLKKQ